MITHFKHEWERMWPKPTPKFKSATEAIVHILKTKGRITQKECIEATGHTRLSSTIYRLRKSGMDIQSVEKSVKTRYGLTANIVEYRYRENGV